MFKICGIRDIATFVTSRGRIKVFESKMSAVPGKSYANARFLGHNDWVASET
jgi:hypothetical protein